MALLVPAIFLFAIVLAFGAQVFWVWMLIDCAIKEEEQKLPWILVILFGNLIGATAYLVLRKLNRLDDAGVAELGPSPKPYSAPQRPTSRPPRRRYAKTYEEFARRRYSGS